MALLSKQSISAADDFKYAIVECPEWGGDVRVRGLTAAEQSNIYKRYNDGKSEDFDVLLVTMGCVDEDGNRVFTNDDKDMLRKKSFAVLDRIAKKVIELSGDNTEEGIETARKN